MSLTSKQLFWKQVIVGSSLISGAVGLIVFGLWLTDTKKDKVSPMERAQAEAQELVVNYRDQMASELTPHDKWISKSEQDLTSYKTENKQLHERLSDLEGAIARLSAQDSKKALALKNQRKSLLDEPLPLPDQAKTPSSFVPDPPAVPPGGPSIDSFQVGQSSLASPATQGNSSVEIPAAPELEVFTISGANEAPVKNVSHYLPAGSFVTVSLLSGVDAATGGASTKNAQPILMRLMDFGILPNRYRANIVDCHVTGHVRGDISSERARVRSEFLSCVFENGDIAEVKIEGWVNGEDGKDGFRGRLVEKSGALLARSFLSGMFSGLGSSIASQYQNVSQNALGTVTTINPGGATKAGLATGTSTAFDSIAEYYMARANEIFPIIEVSSNRLGELVLQKGVDLGPAFAAQLQGGR